MTDLRFTPGQAVDAKRAMRLGAFRVAEYRLKNMLKWWDAILAFGLGNPILYLVSIGIGIGSLVDKSTGGHALGGVSYLQFVAPALLASAAIQGVMDEVTFPVFAGFMWEKFFFAIAATAVSAKQIANGVFLAACVRGLLQVFMYGIVLMLFGAIPPASFLPLVLSSLLAGFGFGAVMLAVMARIKKDDGVFAIISRFIIAPMFLFSGTFYPLSGMPIYLQWVGWISPLWHATDVGRVLTIGEPIAPWLMVVHFAYFVAMLIGGLALTYPPFKARLAE
jgi:lipooligosaccharide transport system permease protein